MPKPLASFPCYLHVCIGKAVFRILKETARPQAATLAGSGSARKSTRSSGLQRPTVLERVKFCEAIGAGQYIFGGSPHLVALMREVFLATPAASQRAVYQSVDHVCDALNSKGESHGSADHFEKVITLPCDWPTSCATTLHVHVHV